ncbi:response regulator transcription factor [Flavobacterium sp. SE-s28]|uniref:Response regulator transcription factor n=2 Tax=Flavobacterium silvaticum TaxID=1852020 RepID=A0A972G185_9FLAO|nr:response regulator transcription factor [Flavobacterium silvaticum]
MLCGQIPALEIVQAFNDPLLFLEKRDELDFDLCITDIEMPGIDGLSLARALKGKLVIFVTAYKEHAADAFEIDAIDYLTKPIKLDRLEKAVQKCLTVFEKQTAAPQFLRVNTDKGKSFLYFSNVSMISTAEQDSRDKKVMLSDGKQMLLKNMTFDFLLDSLPADQFCRVNKKDIVALSAVNHYTHSEVILKTATPDISVSLTETYRKEFLQKVASAGLIT